MSSSLPHPDAELAGVDTVLLEQMEESVAVYRTDAMCLYVNPATERLAGGRSGQMVGRLLWDAFPETVGTPFQAAFQRVAATGALERFEHLYTPSERWFTSRILRSGERVYVFTRETTEERRRQEALRESEERMACLLEEAQHAEQRSAFLAQASEVLASSLDHEEILQRLARLAVPSLADWCAVDVPAPGGQVRRVSVAHVRPERVEQARTFHERYPIRLDAPNGIGKVLRTGVTDFAFDIPHEFIERVVPDPEHRRDTLELGLSSYISVPLLSRERTFAALTLVYADSGRHYNEADVRFAEDLARRAATSLDNGRLYQEAQEAVRARDAFLSIASHELNTPITSLKLNVQALQRLFEQLPPSALPPGALHVKLQGVQRQVSRLSSLVRELLDVSRITVGKLRLECEELELTALVRDLVPRFQEDLARARSELRLHLPESVVGTWDRLRVEQILQNLLSNAIKYGGGRPIEVRLEADADRARLTVRDEGLGIAPEGQARLFQRFERVASERHYGGFGLGLWIVKQIVDALGGRIHLESALGKGSVFTVELPRRPPPPSAS